MKPSCLAVQCALLMLAACGTEGLEVLQSPLDAGFQIDPYPPHDGGVRDGGPLDSAPGPFTACDVGNESTVEIPGVTNIHPLKITSRDAELALLLEETSPLDPMIRNPIVYRFGLDGPALSRVVVAEDNVDGLVGLQTDVVIGAGPNGTSAHTDYQIFTRMQVGQTTLLRLTRNLHGDTTPDTTVFTATSGADVDAALRAEERVLFTAADYALHLHNRSLTTAEIDDVVIAGGEFAQFASDPRLVLGGNVVWSMFTHHMFDEDGVVNVAGFDRRLNTVIAPFEGPRCRVIFTSDVVVTTDRIAIVVDCSTETILWTAEITDPSQPTVTRIPGGVAQAPSRVAWDGKVFVVATWLTGESAAVVRDFRPDGTPLGILARLPAETERPRDVVLTAMVDQDERRLALAYATGEPLSSDARTVLYRFDSCRE